MKKVEEYQLAKLGNCTKMKFKKNVGENFRIKNLKNVID